MAPRGGRTNSEKERGERKREEERRGWLCVARAVYIGDGVLERERAPMAGGWVRRDEREEGKGGRSLNIKVGTERVTCSTASALRRIDRKTVAGVRAGSGVTEAELLAAVGAPAASKSIGGARSQPKPAAGWLADWLVD